MTLPALSLLIERGVRVRCFGQAWATDLLAGMPVGAAAMPRGLWAGARALSASGATEGLMFTNSPRCAAQMRLAGIAATGSGPRLTRLLLTRVVKRKRGPHEAESFYRRALAALGEQQQDATPPFVRLPLSPRHRQEADAALMAAGVAAPFIVLCPMAVGSVEGRSKLWPHFAALCRELIERGETIVGCPGPGERPAMQAALPGARLLDGLGLGAYAAVLDRAQRVAANDSGPMHLAAVVGAPVLGVFGPSDPGRTRPWSADGRAIGGRGAWPSLDEALVELDRLPARPVRSA